MDEQRRRWLRSVGFTVVLLALVAFAATNIVNYLTFAMIAAIAGAAGAMHLLFPGSRFFSIALANYIAVYTCIYVFFLETNFVQAHRLPVVAGFILPVIAFLAGALWRREEIRRIVATERIRDERHLARIFRWLIPVFTIGALSFLLPAFAREARIHDIALLVSMGVISAIVLFVSRDVSTFLLDTGLLFEEFFARIAKLVAPAFAFLTFYSMIVIVFAAIYRIIDRYSLETHFRINGEAAELSFSDSLYFSIVTLSTVGYGDITPLSSLVKIVIAGEILLGVLLLLFGFSEIIAYSRERDGRRQK